MCKHLAILRRDRARWADTTPAVPFEQEEPQEDLSAEPTLVPMNVRIALLAVFTTISAVLVCHDLWEAFHAH